MPIKSQTNPEPEEELEEDFDEPNLTKIQDAIDNPVVEDQYKEYRERVSEEPVLQTLTLRQKRFCQLYALDARFMGSGVNAYMEVYDVDQEKGNWYKTACVCASKLLRNAKVYTYINELLRSDGLNPQFADKQLLYLMSQHEDKTAKKDAIKEYNRLTQRVIEKVEINHINTKLTPEELNEAILNAIR